MRVKKYSFMLFVGLAAIFLLGTFSYVGADNGKELAEEVDKLAASILQGRDSIKEIQEESLKLEYLQRADNAGKKSIQEYADKNQGAVPKAVPASSAASKSDQVLSGEENIFEFIKAKSKEKINLEFDDITLEETMRVIGEGGDFNIVVDPMVKDQKISLHLKQVTIPEAMSLIFQAYDLSFSKTGNSIFISTKDKIISIASIHKVIRLKNIKAADAQKLVKNMAISVTAEPSINSIVVTGTTAQVAEIERIIAKIDVSRRQVLLITQVLEVTTDALKEVGVDWSNQIPLSFQESARNPDLVGTTIIDPISAMRVYRFDRTPIQVDAIIKMLINNGKAKILSNPKIVTISGEEASIFIGDRVPYEVTRITSGVSNTEVEFVEAGIRLNILPSIIEEDYVVVNVRPEVSFIYAWRGANDQYPWVKTREASVSVKVRNGEPFIVAGLISEVEAVNVYKIPLLGDIPILGWAFKWEKTEVKTNEIIITVIPQIMMEETLATADL